MALFSILELKVGELLKNTAVNIEVSLDYVLRNKDIGKTAFNLPCNDS